MLSTSVLGLRSLGGSGGGSPQAQHPIPQPPTNPHPTPATNCRASFSPKTLVTTFLRGIRKLMVRLHFCDQDRPRMKERWGVTAKEYRRGRWLQAVESNLLHPWCWQSHYAFSTIQSLVLGNKKSTLLIKNLEETELSIFCRSGSLYVIQTF